MILLRRATTYTLALGLAVALAGCTGDRNAREQAAQATADQLAQALSQRKLDSLVLTGGGQAELDAVLAGAARTPAQVAVSDVEVDGDSATADLTWTWATPGQPWTYQSAATMLWADEAWTPQWSPSLVEPSLVAGEALRITREQGRRGDILGADSVPLVKYRKVVQFGIDKIKAPADQAAGSARALARLLDIDPTAYAKRVKKAGAKAFVEAVVLRQADAGAVSPTTLASIPGAVAIEAEVPLAPTRDFAAAILGRVGPATAEIVKESDGAVKAGDLVGLSGLQARYEDQLGGTPGEAVRAVAGKDSRELYAVAPVAGQALVTTLNPEAQKAAEKALAEVKSPSAIVAVRPSTQDILAAAVGPGSNGYNTATAGRYPPGSTMKVVTALALMRAGMKPSDVVSCTERIVVDGKSFKNYDGYPNSRLGRITLLEAIANSCNTALIAQRTKLGDDDLAQAAATLGLGVDHDLGFPAYFGAVPQARTQTGQAAAMIGQGEVLASPLAMAAVAASVAAGQTVIPRLLPELPAASAEPAKPLTAKEARDLRAMMRAVVTEGTATFLADIPGPDVGAKTGTAEFGTKAPLQTHTWMIAHQGDMAVAAFVEVGDTGSTTVGPLLEEFLRAVNIG